MLVSPLTVAILSDSSQDLFPSSCQEPVELMYFNQPGQFIKAAADIYIDCDFDGSPERIQMLNALFPAIVMVNAVNFTIEQIGSPFVRYNGWSGFAHQPVFELSLNGNIIPDKIEQFARSCGMTCLLVPDSIGMVRPRIVSMIINEAWLTAEEKVSRSEDIDLAMKLGTNYPYGPFEWSEKIGLHRIYSLLLKLAETDSKYQPAENLAAAAQSK
jgi:3-hydroxybutyryl-CoA dehydrogenase